MNKSRTALQKAATQPQKVESHPGLLDPKPDVNITLVGEENFILYLKLFLQVSDIIYGTQSEITAYVRRQEYLTNQEKQQTPETGSRRLPVRGSLEL